MAIIHYLQACEAHCKNSKGATLFDVLLVLIIIGLLGGSFIAQYRDWYYNKITYTTRDNMALITTAISDFYFRENRYPCPADITLPNDDEDYGQEDCGLTPTADTLIGGVPFATINISADAALDGWKRKYLYAVTQAQTVSPMPNAGIIQVNDVRLSTSGQCNLLIPNSTPAHYVLISHGELGVGAYSTSGTLVEACNSTMTTLEGENCDNDNVFLNSICRRNEVNNSDYYDDYTTSMQSIPSRKWVEADAGVNPDDIFTDSKNRIGINKSIIDPDVHLDVFGNIRIDEDIQSSSYCDVGGTNCFTSEIISSSGITCPNGAMTGIQYNDAACINAFSTTSFTGSCPAGERMTGIDAGGNPICAP